MDYVLYVYGSVVVAAVYAAVWALAGPRTRLVLSLGAYAFHPHYEPPSRRWRRERANLRGHRAAANAFPSWHQYFADAAAHHARALTATAGLPPDVTLAYDTTPLTPGIDSAPTVTLPATFVPILAQEETPLADALLGARLVRAEQSVTEYGAEHWGDLLAGMNTEERAVYNAAMVEVYEETKAPERAFLDGLDAAIARFTTAMERLDRRTEAAFVGVGANLARAHGGADRWSTGQFPLYEPESAA